ncbi:MAG: DUF72 domain-containing protein [Candidatus Rokubacteria bacterium]|nr:DUF72 domain-containing protein [Candidatus Rokubacteria bacterium]
MTEYRVGICSWTDPSLVTEGEFYPARTMSAEERLRYYATAFDTVEVDASYYALPSVRNAELWVQRTPPGFLFSVKAYSLLTGHHPRADSLPADLRAMLPAAPKLTRRGEIDRSAFPPEALDRCLTLFRDSLRPLDEAQRLGYVLFQLAPWVRFSEGALAYLATLSDRLPGWTVAVEFRDRSWIPDHAAEVLQVLAAAKLAVVCVDAPSTPNAIPRLVEATADSAILRLHGRNAAGWLAQLHGEEPLVREKYDYLYREEELVELVGEARLLGAKAKRIFIVFNNNNRDYPARNALQVLRLLGTPGRDFDSLKAAWKAARPRRGRGKDLPGGLFD